MVKYMLFRTIPEPLNLGAREMEVWVRKDLVPSSDSNASSSSGTGSIRLVAETQIGVPGDGEGQFAQPTNLAVAPDGTLYVADTLNNRIQVFNREGVFQRSIGSRGNGEGQFIEPRGIAVDADGTLYIADTWNARIVKMSPDGQVLASWGSGNQDLGDGKKATITEGTAQGNAANPLGFFGPRGVALDGKGNLYIADTGNKRIVVTSINGEYRFQWGAAGAERGSFNEPTGVAIDTAGVVYVADTWNGRVQAFQSTSDGKVDPVPTISWPVRGWQANTYDDPSIAVGTNGEVFVSIPTSQSVLMTNGRGEALLRWGGPGSDLASLNGPSGIAASPDGSVYVVDRTDGRILRFRVPQIRLNEGQ
jgi:sugar lactone lactonase YvrE